MVGNLVESVQCARCAWAWSSFPARPCRSHAERSLLSARHQGLL